VSCQAGTRFAAEREANLAQRCLKLLGPARPWCGQEERLLAKRPAWAGRRPAEKATDLEGDPNPAPRHGQIKERSPSVAVDLPGQVTTAWAGHLCGGEAGDEGEALLSQNDLLKQQIWDWKQQGGKAHTNILWG
jgi:hypothetical protein